MIFHAYRLRLFLSGAAMVLVVNSCSTLKVNSDLAGSSDFSKYTTYRGIASPNSAGAGKPRYDSPALREQVRKLVDAELAKKRFSSRWSRT